MVPLISKYNVKGEKQRKQEAAVDQTVFCPAAGPRVCHRYFLITMQAGCTIYQDPQRKGVYAG